MADETATPEATKPPPLEPQFITRNDVQAKLTSQEIIKGDRKGEQYLAMIFNTENFEQYVKCLGLQNVIGILNSWSKGVSQRVWFSEDANGNREMIDENGNFKMSLFLKLITDITSVGMKLAEIDRLIDEKTGEQSLLVMNGDVQYNKETGVGTPDYWTIRTLAQEVLDLKDLREKRSKKKNSDAEPSASVSGRS